MPAPITSSLIGQRSLPFVKYEHDSQDHADESSDVVPFELLFEKEHREEREDHERDHLLNDLQLRGCKAIRTNTIRRNLKAVLEEGDTPAHENHLPQYRLAVFEVSVPREGHEDVGDGQQDDGGHAPSLSHGELIGGFERCPTAAADHR